MGQRKNGSLYFFLVFSCLIVGCAPADYRVGSPEFVIENSLAQDKLAYYNDSFDTLREDLWGKSAPASQSQALNFKLADVGIENGEFKVVTKTGSFSAGGLVSKYKLRGDFDVQVDCHIDFLDGVQDMDQVLYFVVMEQGVPFSLSHSVAIGVNKAKGENKSFISTGYREKGRRHFGDWHQIGNFHGTFRIVRKGDKISTFYKKERETGWKKMNTFQSTTNDLVLNFVLTNYIVGKPRYVITANSPISARFDNFIINAAQGVIEEEI